jgi:MinD superfamily P-loop ATPase
MYRVNELECTGCGVCTLYCLPEAITVDEGVARIKEWICTSCGTCYEVCPQGAIEEVSRMPAIHSSRDEPSPPAVTVSPVRVIPRTSQPARREKVAIVAALLPVISRLALNVAGRLHSRRPDYPRREAAGSKGAGGRHRWRGGA